MIYILLGQAEHAAGMGQARNAYIGYLVSKSAGKRALERPRIKIKTKLSLCLTT
jgi:RNase P protein component